MQETTSSKLQDSLVVKETAITILPAEDGLPALIIPELDKETPHLQEYRLLVRCIRGIERSWFPIFGSSIFVGTLRLQRYHLVRPFPASRIFHILGKYVQKLVLLACRIYLKLFPADNSTLISQ